MTCRNLIRFLADFIKGVALTFLSMLVGFIIGQIRGYDRGAADQARLDALVSPEGREHLSRELQKAATNPPPVLIPPK